MRGLRPARTKDLRQVSHGGLLLERSPGGALGSGSQGNVSPSPPLSKDVVSKFSCLVYFRCGKGTETPAQFQTLLTQCRFPEYEIETEEEILDGISFLRPCFFFLVFS